MLDTQGNPPPDESGAFPSDPHCPLAQLYAGHVCRDREDAPLDSRGRACFRGARVQIVGPKAGPVEAAEAIVTDLADRLWGQIGQIGGAA